MATQSKHKKVKGNKQKLKLFRANDPVKSVLMWGINYSMSQLTLIRSKAFLLAEDFKAYLKVAVENNQFNKECMPSTYKFKEYAPLVFRDLRQRFKVNERDYLDSLTRRQPLRKSQPGKKRQSALMFANDRHFIVTLLTADEVDSLQGWLRAYHEYVVNWQGVTLMPQLLGLYRITVADQHVYMLTMRNLFYPPGRFTQKYMIKGILPDKSLADKSEKAEKEKPSKLRTLKDADFQAAGIRLRIGDLMKQRVLTCLSRDLDFLDRHHLKYKLMIGFYDPTGRRFSVPGDGGNRKISTASGCGVGMGGFMSGTEEDDLAEEEGAGGAAGMDSSGEDSDGGGELANSNQTDKSGLLELDVSNPVVGSYGIRDEDDPFTIYYVGLVEFHKRRHYVSRSRENRKMSVVDGQQQHQTAPSSQSAAQPPPPAVVPTSGVGQMGDVASGGEQSDGGGHLLSTASTGNKLFNWLKGVVD